jgi:hypothetical protein
MTMYSNAKGIKEAKEAAGGMQYAGAAGFEAVAAQTARNQAAEDAKLEVFNLLGADGTFGPGSESGVYGDYQNPNNIDDPTSIYDTSGLGLSQPDQNLKQGLSYSTGRKGLLGTARSGILDSKAYAAEVSKSASFRTQSKQVAEAEQLLNQEGPAWDELSGGVHGAIGEGSALQLRDTLRQLRNNAAKGGSARRTAMNEFNTIMAQERAQRTRVENTWKANLTLFDTVRKNADRVQAGTRNFMANLPLVNDQFRAAMNQTANMQMNAGQMLSGVLQNAYAVKQSQQAVNFGENLAEGLIGAVASMIPYVGPALGAAIKQAGAGGGYGGLSVDPETGMVSAGAPAGAASGASPGIVGIGEGGGGSGALSTSQVSAGYDAVSGAVGSAVSAVQSWSDVRMKENIVLADREKDFNIYEFNYLGDTQRYQGVLAQEVIETHPEAVGEREGFLTVDYSMLGIEMRAV